MGRPTRAEAPTVTPTDRRAFDALFAETILHLESRVARTAMWAGGIACGVTTVGILSGSRLPHAIPLVALGIFGWYLAVHLLIRARRYPAWMRYASCLLDVSLGSVVMLLDLHSSGSLFAVTAGGPALYAATVAMATLRLEPRLCLFAGVAAAGQFLAVMLLFIRPAASPELLASGAYDLFVALIKTLLLLVTGVLGWVATQSMRGLLLRLTQSAVERERLRGVLGMHVSEQVMEHLLSGRIQDGGEHRTITVCFTDIRDFTPLSESRPPEEVLRLLNLYFGRMCDIVAAHGGVVNKFLGDGMLIVFGAPAHQPDDAQRALAAAREMLAEVVRMRERGEFPDLRIGIGMHRGEAVVGNVGGVQRQEYTAIGDTVNTASRVQDLTKALGRSLLVTRECREALGAEDLEPLGSHTVKGRVQPLELFTLTEAGAQRAA